MRVSALVGIAFMSLPLVASASSQVSPQDAESMPMEELADRAPDRIQGFTPYIQDLDASVDQTAAARCGTQMTVGSQATGGHSRLNRAGISKAWTVCAAATN